MSPSCPQWTCLGLSYRHPKEFLRLDGVGHDIMLGDRLCLPLTKFLAERAHALVVFNVLFLNGQRFADQVVDYRVGAGNPNPEGRIPMAALGAPDYVGGAVTEQPTVVTLGSGGSLTLRFTDNALVDVAVARRHYCEQQPHVGRRCAGGYETPPFVE